MAEQTRDDILALFEASTGMDLGSSISCLEEVDWDLTKALEKFKSRSQAQAATLSSPRTATPPPVASQPKMPTPTANFSSSYELCIDVRYEDETHTFRVYSSRTIADFKKQVSVKLNIPSTHLHLSGWSRVVNDDMTLGDIIRPRSASVCLTAEKRSDEDRVVSLQLTYPPDCVEEFEFPVKNSILELKQFVAVKSGILVKDQVWSGLPIGATDYSVIRNSNFKNPIHALAVNKKTFVTAESPLSSGSGNNIPFSIDDQEPLEEIYSDYSDSEPDIDLIEDMDDIPKDNFKDPMIPEHCVDQSEALALFSDNFEKRYGPVHPVFYCGSMKEVIHRATQGQLLDRRPVVVYLHHDRSISSNIFCEKILCSKIISDYLTMNYLTWAWDMTMPTNTTRFLDNVSLHFGEETRKQLSGLGPSNYPLLLIFQKKPGSPLEIANMLTIDTPQDDAYNLLVLGYEEHLAAMEQLQATNEARIQREQIKQEQDVAYNESAEKDKQTQRNRIHSQEAKLRERAAQADALKNLPEEPEKGEGITSIRFRYPSGELANRRFFGSDRIGLLYIYAQSKGFHPDRHKLMLNYPKKDLGEYPSNANLVECGLSPQAMVFIQEHFDSN